MANQDDKMDALSFFRSKMLDNVKKIHRHRNDGLKAVKFHKFTSKNKTPDSQFMPSSNIVAVDPGLYDITLSDWYALKLNSATATAHAQSMAQMAQLQRIAMQNIFFVGGGGGGGLANFIGGGGWIPENDDPNRTCPTSEVKLPDGILPGDGKAVGYIHGYRAWKLRIKEGRLFSDSILAHEWEPKKPKKAEDQKVGFGKGAGLYAAKTLELLQTEYDNPGITDTYVIGKVALWGQIKEHQKGYRAEWAYPVSFLKITNVARELEIPLLRALSEIYLAR